MNKKTILAAALASTMAVGAVAPSATAQSSNPNPNVPGSVMSSKLSTLPEDIKQDREEYHNYIQNELNEKPTGFDDFVSGSSTFGDVFLSDKALVNALGITATLGGIAAVIAAAVTGQDVVRDALANFGISPRI